ncbi:hypothetical protein C1645_828286 [Glomus cerebriforme]|uniref:Uncharacterized protein n=1 Tax=Glomus cerebriforme TaxID=658196 RepID=A0A397SQ94_9GLOM|nr:hypothetical protein C1645_828286 [Glomus cerebriforme]
MTNINIPFPDKPFDDDDTDRIIEDEEINNYKIKILHLKTINKTLNNKNENLKKLNNNFNKINNKNILQSSDIIKDDNLKKQTIEPIPKYSRSSAQKPAELITKYDPRNLATTSNPESNISKEWFNIQSTIVKFNRDIKDIINWMMIIVKKLMLLIQYTSEEEIVTTVQHEESINDVLSSQNKDGSFEISSTIIKEFDNASPEAIPLGSYVQLVLQAIYQKNTNKARTYLSTQIGDVELEKDIINASNKVVIDISSEKLKNENLKNSSPFVWYTALSMQYLKYIADQSETNCADNYNKAKEYIQSQLGDDNLEKELLKISKQYVIDSVTCKIVKQKEERTLRVRKFVYDKETKEASIFYLKKGIMLIMFVNMFISKTWWVN